MSDQLLAAKDARIAELESQVRALVNSKLGSRIPIYDGQRMTNGVIDRSVLEQALVVLFTAEQNGEEGCIVCCRGWEPTKDLPIKHSEHCGLVRVRDALKEALGQ